jgi:hypothetical protein
MRCAAIKIVLTVNIFLGLLLTFLSLALQVFILRAPESKREDQINHFATHINLDC